MEPILNDIMVIFLPIRTDTCNGKKYFNEKNQKALRINLKYSYKDDMLYYSHNFMFL